MSWDCCVLEPANAHAGKMEIFLFIYYLAAYCAMCNYVDLTANMYVTYNSNYSISVYIKTNTFFTGDFIVYFILKGQCHEKSFQTETVGV